VIVSAGDDGCICVWGPVGSSAHRRISYAWQCLVRLGDAHAGPINRSLPALAYLRCAALAKASFSHASFSHACLLTCMPRLTRCSSCGVVQPRSLFNTECSRSRCVAMVVCRLSLTSTHAHARAIASRWRLNPEKNRLNAEVDSKKSKEDNKQSLMPSPPLGMAVERARWGAAEQAARVSTQVCRVWCVVFQQICVVCGVVFLQRCVALPAARLLVLCVSWRKEAPC